MKRNLLKSTSIALAIMIAFSSCNKNEEVVTSASQAQELAMKELKFDIEQLNKEKFGDAQLSETRIPRWLRWIITVAVDAGVSIASNIGTGISASTLAWTVTKDEVTPAVTTSSINPPGTSLKYLTPLAPVNGNENDYGYIHNKVICDLYDLYGEGLFDLSIEELLPLVGHKVAEVTGKPYVTPSFTNEQESIELLENAMNLYKKSETSSQFMNGLKRQYPSIANELDVLQTTLEGYQHIDINTDKGEYAREVIQLVNKANISDYSKQTIVSGVSVANASTRLWNTSSLSQ